MNCFMQRDDPRCQFKGASNLSISQMGQKKIFRLKNEMKGWKIQNRT